MEAKTFLTDNLVFTTKGRTEYIAAITAKVSEIAELAQNFDPANSVGIFSNLKNAWKNPLMLGFSHLDCIKGIPLDDEKALQQTLVKNGFMKHDVDREYHTDVLSDVIRNPNLLPDEHKWLIDLHDQVSTKMSISQDGKKKIDTFSSAATEFYNHVLEIINQDGFMDKGEPKFTTVQYSTYLVLTMLGASQGYLSPSNWQAYANYMNCSRLNREVIETRSKLTQLLDTRINKINAKKKLTKREKSKLESLTYALDFVANDSSFTFIPYVLNSDYYFNAIAHAPEEYLVQECARLKDRAQDMLWRDGSELIQKLLKTIFSK